MSTVGDTPSAFDRWRHATLELFRHRAFALFWQASLFYSFGSLIQTVGASWLMATISPGAEQVALVQKVGALLGAITPARLLALTFLIGPRNPLPPEPLGSAIAAAAPPDPGYNFDQTLA